MINAPSTTTLFFSVRLERNTVFVFDPEIAGGKGFSGVDGIADPPNGEIPRVATATPQTLHRPKTRSSSMISDSAPKRSTSKATTINSPAIAP